jgi:hypothetical protein
MRRKLRNIFDQYEQKENHITNSLLLVLNSNRKLLRSILKKYKLKLTSRQINLLSQTAPRIVKERDSIPDGYIYTEDFSSCIGIETKIQENSVDEVQIKGHVKQLLEYGKWFLLVITPDEEEPRVITKLRGGYRNIRFLSWPELLTFMAEVGPDNKKNHIGQYLFREFMSYMERNYHMTPFSGFKFNEGYDPNLATHYVKRVSASLTPRIQKKYPDCVYTRSKIHGAWEAWSPSEQVNKSTHLTFSVQPHQLRCFLVLPHGCPQAWRRLREVLGNDASIRALKKHLRGLYDKSPRGAETVISFRQRHYYPRTTPVIDAKVIINVGTLLGINRSKQNDIWWRLLEDVSDSKSRYNYQMEIGHDLKYDKVPDLETPEAVDIMFNCFSGLKPIYGFLVKS